jgi:hypothetical protein
VCGAVVALGVSALVFKPAPESPGAWKPAVNASGGPAGITGGHAEKESGQASMEDQIATLKRWLERGGAEVLQGEMYDSLGEWSERDPRAALAWVNGAKRFPQRLHALAIPLAKLATENPAETGAWIRQNVGPQDWARVAELVFGRIAQDNPREALTLAFSFPAKDLPNSVGGALGALITEAPQEALGYFARLSGEKRIGSAGEMMAAWARKDPAAALAWGQGQPELLAVGSVRSAFFFEMIRTRPDMCVEFIRQFPSPDQASDDSYMLSELIGASPEHGLSALTLVDKKTAQEALTSWTARHFETAPERAVDLVRRWVPEEKRSTVFREGFVAWLNSDERSAQSWLATVAEPELRTALQAGLLNWQIERDPQAALALLKSPQATTPEMQEVVSRAVGIWTERDVTTVAGWLQANPGLASPEQAIHVVRTYLEQNEVEASTWLTKLPPGETRDAAVGTAAVYWADQNEPSLATEVALSIQNSEMRTQALYNVYRMFRYTDSAAAENWLASQEMSPDIKQSWQALAKER